MAADLLLPACVPGAVMENDLADAPNRGGVERGVLLPRHDAVADGRAKARSRMGRNDRVRLRRFYERTKHPRLLPWRPTGDGDQDAATGESHRSTGGGEARLRGAKTAAATPSRNRHDPKGKRAQTTGRPGGGS